MDFKLYIPQEEIKKLNKATALRAGLLKGVTQAMIFAEGEAKETFGRTGHLRVQSGRLRSSIKGGANRRGNKVIGYIGSNVSYAAIHEFGGMAGRGLRSKIPARPYLRPSVENNIIELNRIIQKAIRQEVDKDARQ
jgi:phage gpG-like protein